MSSLLTQLGQKVKAKLDNKFDKSGGLISGAVNISQSLQIGSYLTSSLPTAGTSGRLIYVSDGDGSGGPCIAVDDGTDWKIVELGGAVPTVTHILAEDGDSLTTEVGDILITEAV
jgi:hypothetical protein